MKYIGWVLSLVLLVVLIVVYSGWNKANADSTARVDNVTANYNALVAQNTQREAQWQTTLAKANSSLATQVAQDQVTLNSALATAVANVTAQLNTQWQNILNSAVANTTAQVNAQW